MWVTLAGEPDNEHDVKEVFDNDTTHESEAVAVQAPKSWDLVRETKAAIESLSVTSGVRPLAKSLIELVMVVRVEVIVAVWLEVLNRLEFVSEFFKLFISLMLPGATAFIKSPVPPFRHGEM